MAKGAHLFPSQPRYKAAQVEHRLFPVVLVEAFRGGAISMAALVIAVNVANALQCLDDRSIDTAVKSGCVEYHDRITGAAPIVVAQSESVYGQVAASGHL